MPFGLYISAEGANVQTRRQDVIANNLANVDTVGFKKDLAVFQARYAEGIEQGLVPADAETIENEGGGVMTVETVTDFSGAPLKRTGRPLDMAVRGDGFFAVQKDGETFLTRAGDFRLTEQGTLVTQQGYPVLNFRVERRCKTGKGDWHGSPSFFLRDLADLETLCRVAYEKLSVKERNLVGPEAANVAAATELTHKVVTQAEAST